MHHQAAVRRVGSSGIGSLARERASSRLRVVLLAAAAATVVAWLPSAPVRAANQLVDASGTGASAQFQSTGVVGGTPVVLTASVFVSTPADSAGPASVAVSVTEVDAVTGQIRFTGTGSGPADRFDVGTGLGFARLQAVVSVLSTTTGARRRVELDLEWLPDDSTASIDTDTRGKSSTGFVNESHDGDVRRMTATGVVAVSDPAVSGHALAITTPAPGAVWSTTDTAKLTGSPSTTGSSSTAGTTAGTASTSSGYWTGYWTWRWDGTKWVATWTWVWKRTDGTYQTS